MSDASAPPAPFSLGRALWLALKPLIAQPVLFLVSSLGATVALGLLQLTILVTTVATTNDSAVKSDDAVQGLGLMGELALGGLIQAAFLSALLVQGAAVAMDGARAAFRPMISAAIRQVLPVAAILFITGAAVWLSSLALVIPGLIVAMIWAVAAPARVVEKLPLMKAFARSNELTRGHRWAVLGFSLIVLLINGGLIAGLGLVDVSLFEQMAATTDNNPIAGLLLLLAAMVVYALLQAALALTNALSQAALFVELKTLKNQAGAGATASVFD